MRHQSISIRQIPLTVVAIVFSLGIIGHKYLDIPNTLLLIFSLILITGLLALSNSQFQWNWRGPALLFLILITGALHSSFQQYSSKKNTIAPEIVSVQQRYKAEVVSRSSSEKYLNLKVILREFEHTAHGDFNLPRLKALIKIKKTQGLTDFNPGNLLEINAILKSTTSSQSKTNQYEASLQKKGIAYLSYVDTGEITLLSSQSYSFWKKIRYEVRSEALNIIDKSALSKQSKSISKALLLGYKDDLTNQTRQSFIDSGIMHILAVSGLHVGIIAYLLFLLTGRLLFGLYKYSFYKVIIVGLGLILFAEISGGAAPVWRAVTMTIIYLMGRSLSYKSHPLNLMALAAIILLLYDHQFIFNLSFQFSFLAVVGIILIYPILEYLYKPRHRVGKYIFGIVYMGIAAQLVLLPLSFYYFNQASILSPITSLVAIPAAFIIVIGGISIIGINWISPTLSDLISTCLDIVITILQSSSEIMANVNSGRVEHVYITNIETMILTAAIFFCIRAYYVQSIQPLKVGMCLLLFQGVHHSFIQISHINCINVVYDNSENINEIHLGLTSYVYSNDDNTDYNQNEARREHHISKVINMTNSSETNQRL